MRKLIVFQYASARTAVSVSVSFVFLASGLGRDAESYDRGAPVAKRLLQLWNDESGQDIAEYAVMLAVILVIVVGTIRLIGSNANNVFSQVGSAIQ